MSGFSVDIASLSPGSHRIGLECEASELGLSQQDWPRPVRGDFDVQKSGDQVRVKGLLSAVASLECVRCLKTFELPLRPPFAPYAARARPGRPGAGEALERDAYTELAD